jgi:WD40 repeat protein
VSRLWRRHTGEPVGVLVARTRRVCGVAFSRTGRLLVSGAEDGQVCLWDTERPVLIRTRGTPKCPVALFTVRWAGVTVCNRVGVSGEG